MAHEFFVSALHPHPLVKETPIRSVQWSCDANLVGCALSASNVPVYCCQHCKYYLCTNCAKSISETADDSTEQTPLIDKPRGRLSSHRNVFIIALAVVCLVVLLLLYEIARHWAAPSGKPVMSPYGSTPSTSPQGANQH